MINLTIGMDYFRAFFGSGSRLGSLFPLVVFRMFLMFCLVVKIELSKVFLLDDDESLCILLFCCRQIFSY
jgi:hypothetical protein